MQVNPIWPNAGNSQDKQIRKVVEGDKKREIKSKRTQGEGGKKKKKKKKVLAEGRKKERKRGTKDNLEIEEEDGLWEICKIGK
jgi:hypothetical protein